MFNVDTILAIFRFIVKLLEATQAKQSDLANSYQATIDELSAAKGVAIAEAKRASAVAKNIKALLA